MGRAPCCEKIGLRKGKWTTEEDEILANYIKDHGEGSWRSLPKKAGLLRCGKSCRLRWINYLRAGLKRGNFSKEEDELIVKLHATLGNRWSQIARDLPGRTDNEIKNYWNSHLSRSIHRYHVIRDNTTETESVESLKNSQKNSGNNNAKMAEPKKKIKKIRKKEMLVEEVIIPETSLEFPCNESQNQFSSHFDEAVWNSNNDAFSRPFSPSLFNNSEYLSEPIKSPAEYSCTTDEHSTSKEDIINGPSSPDLNSIFKEIDNLLNSEIKETDVAHGTDGSHKNMPGDSDAQNGSLVPKDVGFFGDLDCLDFLCDLDIWSSVWSIEDESLQHIIV